MITSLDSSSSSSRSRSQSPPRRFLNQPGSQGFTLSPSLLTHLLNARKDDLRAYGLGHLASKHDKGLVLYKPMGIPPGMDDIVKTWRGAPRLDEDEGRFEDLDEDEDTSLHPAAGGAEEMLTDPSAIVVDDSRMEVE